MGAEELLLLTHCLLEGSGLEGDCLHIKGTPVKRDVMYVCARVCVNLLHIILVRDGIDVIQTLSKDAGVFAFVR